MNSDGSIGNNVIPFEYNNIKENIISNKEGEVVNEDRILEKYIDKIDNDRRDQEERLNKNMELMETRIVEERRLSEERMEKKFDKVMEQLAQTNKDIEMKINKLESKIESTTDKIDTTNKWVIGICISTIIGITAIAVAVGLAIYFK